MITVTTMFIVQVIIVSWIAITNPEPCPKKYMDMSGDVTAMVIKGIIILQFILIGCTTIPCPKKYMDSKYIARYCELDYGGKFKLIGE
jgi:hypothetical protein